MTAQHHRGDVGHRRAIDLPDRPLRSHALNVQKKGAGLVMHREGRRC
jgi:hypothetical protein